MRKTLVLVAVAAVSMIATAEVAYIYENDGKTYVATVSAAETSISDEAIGVLNENTVTNFVIRGDKAFLVDKGSSFTGDVLLDLKANITFATDNVLGVAPGVIRSGKDRLIYLEGATVSKKLEIDCEGSWSKNTGLKCMAGNSLFKEEVSFTYGNFCVYPYVNSYVRFEGGMAGGGYLYFREASGGIVEITKTPINLKYPISLLEGKRTSKSDYGFHLIFSVAGNNIVTVGNKGSQANRFTCSKLSTTVNWAFDNVEQRIEFGSDSLWDLCGTSQRVGALHINRLNHNGVEGPLSIITNSSATASAKLYLNPDVDSNPQVVFGGDLSVDFSGAKTTTLEYPSSARGEIAVNGGTLAFTGNGSWKNAERVSIANGASVSIVSGSTFGLMTEIQLNGNGKLAISAGEGGAVVTQTVGFLTVDGVAKEHGFYEMGEGVLEVLYDGRRDVAEGLLHLEGGETFSVNDYVICDSFDKIILGNGAKLELLTARYFTENAAFTLNLGEGCELLLGEGIELYVASGSVAGENLAPGRYTSSNAEWLKGAGAIYVPYGTIAGTEVNWTAAGSDTLMTNPDNWAQTVNLLDGSTYAVFASGNAATVAGDTFLNGFSLNESGSFEIRVADGDAQLRIASGGINASGVGPYAISAPIRVEGDQTWQIAKGQELEVSGSISSDPLARYAIHKKGEGELVLREDSDFAGDIYLDEGTILLKNDMTMGSDSGTIIVGPKRALTLWGATLKKDLFFNNYDSSDWNNHMLKVWEGASTVNGKITFGNRNLDIFFWGGSDIVLKGGVEDDDRTNAGYFRLRPGNGGRLTFEGKPIKVRHSMTIRPDGYDSTGSAGVITIAVTGNELPGIGGDNGKEDLRPNKCTLRTTVDWALDNPGKTMMLGHDAFWDLCGTVQRVGHLDTKEQAGCNPTVVTNSSEQPAMLYVNQTKNTTPWIDFAGDLSVDISGNFKTVINRAMTAKGDLTVNSGTLSFEEGGSWRNAENIEVNGAAKITIAKSGVFHRAANMSLASVASLDLASGVAMRVASLKIDGAEMPFGDYQFGSGTLSVGPVAMRIIVR